MAYPLNKSTFGQGTPLVLLHGWGLNSGVWLPLIEHLTSHVQVITVDLPGFGKNSDVLPEQYDLSSISEMVVETVGEPAIYLGWSLGGLVASQIALQFPDSCRGLVTVASSPAFKATDNWPGIKPEYLTAFYRQLGKDIGKTLDNFLKIQAMGSPHIRKEIKLLHQLVMEYPLPAEQALHAGLGLLETVDLKHQLSNVKCPFYRMYGKLDSLVPKATKLLVDELAPNSGSIMFEQASHAPFISHQQEFLAELLTWLKQEYSL